MQDKCLMRPLAEAKHPLFDAASAVGIVGEFRLGRAKAPNGPKVEPRRIGRTVRAPSNLHWTFGAGKTKSQFGYCSSNCTGFGHVAIPSNYGVRENSGPKSVIFLRRNMGR